MSRHLHVIQLAFAGVAVLLLSTAAVDAGQFSGNTRRSKPRQRRSCSVCVPGQARAPMSNFLARRSKTAQRSFGYGGRGAWASWSNG